MEVHDELADQAAAYALGTLTYGERADFEAHLASCRACAAEVHSLALAIGALAYAAPTAEPGPSLAVRDRLLARVTAPPKTGADQGDRPWPGLRPVAPARETDFAASTGTLGRFAFAASIVLAVVLGGYAFQLRGRVNSLEARLHDATLRAEAGERQMAALRHTAFEAESTTAVLAAPDLVRIDLAGQPAAPNASARALWSRSRGLVFTASNLPAPPPGRAYQLWVLTAQPAPISAGMLTLDARGRVSAMIDTPADLPSPTAMAVTLEPVAGVPLPTGDKYLVGLAH